MTVEHGHLTIDWLGYATVRIATGDTVVYLDPGRYGVLTGEWTPPSERAAEHHPPGRDVAPQDGDLVLVTHRHHYDPEGIERVAAPDATVIVFEGMNLGATDRTDVRPVELPFDVRTVGDEADLVAAESPIWTVPAYNHPDGPRLRADGSPIHPEGRGCGFLLALEGTKVFYPGDTDVLEGHAELDVDVFLPPIGGAFTMDRHEAADLAVELDPDLVVPVHYDTFAAIETDVTAFADDLASRGVAVALE